MISIFGKTKDLIVQLDNFIDHTAQSCMHFKEGVRLYLEKRMDDFDERMLIIQQTENEADNIRKSIEAQLYRQTLIPESRGDVLGILESMDNIIDRAKMNMLEFSIEKPVVPDKIKAGFIDLTVPVIFSVESLTIAVRAFFYNINTVKDHLHKVKFYEKEADILAEKLKREIFNMKIDLSRKMHLRSFVYHIDTLADLAEDVSDRLAIATIKRIV